MKEAQGTIQEMIARLEDCFNERMYNDRNSPLRKYGLEDFDIELYEATEVKVDFKKHWELPQFSDYCPVFMLRCLNNKPTQGDVFTFHIAFHSGKLTNADAVSQKRMIKEVRDRYNINAPQERDPR